MFIVPGVVDLGARDVGAIAGLTGLHVAEG